jgi:hypothetical protein
MANRPRRKYQLPCLDPAGCYEAAAKIPLPKHIGEDPRGFQCALCGGLWVISVRKPEEFGEWVEKHMHPGDLVQVTVEFVED